jgi:hypothetical protein
VWIEETLWATCGDGGGGGGEDRAHTRCRGPPAPFDHPSGVCPLFCAAWACWCARWGSRTLSPPSTISPARCGVLRGQFCVRTHTRAWRGSWLRMHVVDRTNYEWGEVSCGPVASSEPCRHYVAHACVTLHEVRKPRHSPCLLHFPAHSLDPWTDGYESAHAAWGSDGTRRETARLYRPRRSPLGTLHRSL